MTVRWETVEVGGSPMRVYLGVPDAKGPLPGVLVAQHGTGVDAQIQDTVHRLFRAGYIAAAPELYHRQGPELKTSAERVGALRDDEVIADLRASVALMQSQPMPLGPIGIVGFCMGGRVSYLAAATMKELKASVVFYGSSILKSAHGAPAPIERTRDIECPVISFSGTADINATVEQMKTLEAELKRLNKWHEFHFYEGAPHSFHNFADPRYRDEPARDSWEKTRVFLSRFLKTG